MFLPSMAAQAKRRRRRRSGIEESPLSSSSVFVLPSVAEQGFAERRRGQARYDHLTSSRRFNSCRLTNGVASTRCLTKRVHELI
jgi:hypothetical protein